LRASRVAIRQMRPYEAQPIENGERLIWLEERWLGGVES
jgi:hypothetical protein